LGEPALAAGGGLEVAAVELEIEAIGLIEDVSSASDDSITSPKFISEFDSLSTDSLY